MKNILFAINVDWYFNLHWKDRVLSQMTKGLNVHVCYSSTKQFAPRSAINTHLYKLHRSSTNPFNNLKTLYSCFKIVKSTNPTIIHSVTVKPNVFFGIISLIKRIPILITIPGLGSVFSSDQLKYKFYQKLILTLYKLIARNHCYFIFENPSDQNLFLNKNICSSVNSSISPGAGIDLHKFTFSTEPTLTKNKIRVLFAARMIYGKGLERLIKAVDALNMQGCNFQLDVAGILDNESHESIPEKKIIQWHQQGKINWLGQVQDIPRLLKDVNIVALPTTYAEGLPRILLEAASIGRAIITTNNAGCRSLIKHNYNGLLVNPKDTEQLIRALHAYQDRDMRASHGRRSRKIIEQKFTLNHVIDCYQKAYVTLLTKTT